MYCSKCGQEVPPNGVYCPSCGTTTDRGQEAPSSQKSRIVAGILGILLGGLGIHRFYLGYTSIGVIQIIVSIITLGIGGLWGFVEGILILVGNFNKDAQDQPLKD
ncbi:MAG: TM2 domain-containing protein [Dehalococcoidia bacterium]|nr:TM2 domain-containing protein [Dehalococcoidia bacterium]